MLTSSALVRLHPVAPSEALPDSSDEASGTILGIAAVVLTHDLLDGLSGLISLVEWDGADIVV